MKALRTPLQRLTPLGASLVLLLACGDDTSGGGGSGGDNAGGQNTGAQNTGGENTGAGNTGGNDGGGGSENTGGGGAPSTGGAGGSGGSGGDGGGGNETPVQELEMVGDPAWMPTDYHQFSVDLGNNFSNFMPIAISLLPEPNHTTHPQIGISPGAAHLGPYDGEFAAGVLANGYVDKVAFTQAEGLLPNGIFAVWMVVPTAAAPTGSSPDFASGPIIPNEVFPIVMSVDAYQNDVLLDGYSYSFPVPPLDDQLNPPFDVDGHSHFPIFDAEVFDGMTALPGTLETRVSMIDANGDGWNITMYYVALP